MGNSPLRVPGPASLRRLCPPSLDALTEDDLRELERRSGSLGDLARHAEGLVEESARLAIRSFDRIDRARRSGDWDGDRNHH
eukprot:gene47306-58309_t